MRKSTPAIAALVLVVTTLTPLVASQTNPNRASQDADRLFGRRWNLTEVRGASVKTSKAYLEFDRDTKRFSGNGGCNRISGGFDRDGTSLRFSRVMSTKMACLDRDAQQLEIDFFRALEQTTNFQITNELLHLHAGRAPILTFRTAAAEAARVSGTVTYLQRIALSKDAIVEVKLVDVSRADTRAGTIAEKKIKPAWRQVPIPFELSYDPSRIHPRRRYLIEARIFAGGRLRFINTQVYPVITGGHPDQVSVIVKPVRR